MNPARLSAPRPTRSVEGGTPPPSTPSWVVGIIEAARDLRDDGKVSAEGFSALVDKVLDLQNEPLSESVHDLLTDLYGEAYESLPDVRDGIVAGLLNKRVDKGIRHAIYTHPKGIDSFVRTLCSKPADGCLPTTDDLNAVTCTRCRVGLRQR